MYTNTNVASSYSVQIHHCLSTKTRMETIVKSLTVHKVESSLFKIQKCIGFTEALSDLQISSSVTSLRNELAINDAEK